MRNGNYAQRIFLGVSCRYEGVINRAEEESRRRVVVVVFCPVNSSGAEIAGTIGGMGCLLLCGLNLITSFATRHKVSTSNRRARNTTDTDRDKDKGLEANIPIRFGTCFGFASSIIPGLLRSLLVKSLVSFLKQLCLSTRELP